MKIIETDTPEFKEFLHRVRNRITEIESNVEQSVKKIISEVKNLGDDALFEFSRKYDAFELNEKNIEVSQEELRQAGERLNPEVKRALKIAAERIKTFHKKLLPPALVKWSEGKNYLKKVVKPVESVGVYVPGGKASYPSTVLMNAIPARVAGVKRIVMVTPPGRDGKINPAVLYAAKIAGVKKIYRVGGAHAIAALAFGTESVPRVDKIVGPGNIFVATAKSLLSSTVGTDLFAGPSELVVLADDTARPDFIAADLLSQAEHDEMALTVLVTTSKELVLRVKDEIIEQLNRLKTKEVATVSIRNNNYLVLAKNDREAIKIVNEISPEHLEIMHKGGEELADKVKNAGTIFIGEWTPEPVGDYIAGSNHVLPTGGTARFASGLSVLDFLKATNIIFFNRRKLHQLYLPAAHIAEIEGLDAHARSLKIRFEGEKD